MNCIRLCAYLIFYIALTIVTLSLPSHASSGIDSANLCESQLLQVSNGTKWLGKFRSYVMSASNRYGENYPDRKISMFRGNEYRYLTPAFIPNSHMFYIAAGGDAYRALVDYPGVENYHLLDRLTGWGESPLHIIFTIKHRLEQMAVSVTFEKLGFLQTLSEPSANDLLQLSANEYLNKIEKHKSMPEEPIILKAVFQLPGSNEKVEKRIWIHSFDMHLHQDIAAVLGTFPKEDPLVGVLMAGIMGTPDSLGMNLLLNRLTFDGWFMKDYGGQEYPFGVLTGNSSARKKAISDINDAFAPFLGVDQVEVQLTDVYKFANTVENIVMMLRKNRGSFK